MMREESKRKKELLQLLHTLVDRPVRLMVACGNQNRTLLRTNTRKELPEKLELVAGPGCSVCVMPAGHIDAFVKVGMQPGVITAACEDLLQVRGSGQSLGTIHKKGARVEVINTPHEALAIAKKEPNYTVVYPAVGFEATAVNVAEVILEAARLGIENFCIIPSIRLLPPTISWLLADTDLGIQGLLCSASINTISDAQAYRALAERHKIACYIGGFTINEILTGLIHLVRQVKGEGSGVYSDAHSPFSLEEHQLARSVVSQVFFAVDADWRGLGTVEQSGFVIRDELALYDATKRFNVRFQEGRENCMCHCNAIISGRGLPTDCPAFGMTCLPENPVGPCMISNEGICHSYFTYGLQGGTG